MGKAFDFLTEAGTYFLCTTDGDMPSSRPFGSKYLSPEGVLHVSTTNNKAVYKQLIANAKVALVAMKPDRSWIRITGTAVELEDMELKLTIMRSNPRMTEEMIEQQKETSAIFRIENPNAVLYESGKDAETVEI